MKRVNPDDPLLVNLRAHFRVVFPLGARPWLVLDGWVLPVLDCSEQGIRILAPEEARPEVEEELTGRIRFPNGEEREVTGTAIRHTEDGIAVQLRPPGIDFSTILRLQLHLRKRFWLADQDSEPARPGESASIVEFPRSARSAG